MALGTNYYVLGTDYFQYAVIWACEDLEEGQSREFALINSRTPELPESYEEDVARYVERFFDPELFRETEQDFESCFGDSANLELRKSLAKNKVKKN